MELSDFTNGWIFGDLQDGNGASKFSRLHLWTKPLDLMHAEYLQRESACGNNNW